MDDHPPRLRVLLFAEAVTITHLARPAQLARALAAAGHQALLVCPSRWEQVLDGLPAEPLPLASLAPDEFLRRLAAGEPVYRQHELERMVEEDLSLIARTQPDLVVGDFRLSLGISTRLAQVPYANLINAYWNPAARVTPWPVPEVPLVRLAGARLSGGIFNLVQPLIRRLHARPLDAVRRTHGLAPLGDMRAAYCDADLLLHPDPPGLVPLGWDSAPYQMIGHLAWSPPDDRLPAWWGGLPPGRGCIYVCMGSSGAVDRLDDICAGAAAAGLPVVCATAGRARPAARPGLLVAEWVPGEQIARRARLVICNGGSPSSYQALAAGTPVLGLPTNLDQHLAIGSITAAGLGRHLRAGQATPSAVAAAVAALLSDELMAARVDSWATGMAGCDPARVAVKALTGLPDAVAGRPARQQIVPPALGRAS